MSFLDFPLVVASVLAWEVEPGASWPEPCRASSTCSSGWRPPRPRIVHGFSRVGFADFEIIFFVYLKDTFKD